MRYLMVFAVLAVFTLQGCQENASLKTPQDKLSYAIGQNIGQSMINKKVTLKSSVKLNPQIVSKGVKDYLGGRSLLSQQEINQLLLENIGQANTNPGQKTAPAQHQ